MTCMRSFSSLVSGMLGQHPGLYGLPEVNPFLAGTLGEAVAVLRLVRRRTLDGLYRAVAEIEFGSQTEAAVKRAEAWVGERHSWTPTDLMGHLADRVAPRRLVEKSPSTVLTPDRVALALRLLPEARVLHLTRHPVATTSSIAKIAKGAAAGGRDPEDAWFGTNLAILTAGAGLPAGRYMAVRGEDVLGDPDQFLRQIAGWLELDATEADLAAMRRPEEGPFAFVGPPSAPFGADPNFLRNPTFICRPIRNKSLDAPLDWAPAGRRLRSRTVALAQILGYHDAD
jgi:hypothetical protein